MIRMVASSSFAERWEVWFRSVHGKGRRENEKTEVGCRSILARDHAKL
jgi:hypothetical protein